MKIRKSLRQKAKVCAALTRKVGTDETHSSMALFQLMT